MVLVVPILPVDPVVPVIPADVSAVPIVPVVPVVSRVPVIPVVPIVSVALVPPRDTIYTAVPVTAPEPSEVVVVEELEVRDGDVEVVTPKSNLYWSAFLGVSGLEFIGLRRPHTG